MCVCVYIKMWSSQKLEKDRRELRLSKDAAKESLIQK